MSDATEVEEQFEHPEDRVGREEAERYGKAHAKEFCEAHPEAMISLISTWSDGAALESLERLREQFWARDWKPKGTK